MKRGSNENMRASKKRKNPEPARQGAEAEAHHQIVLTEQQARSGPLPHPETLQQFDAFVGTSTGRRAPLTETLAGFIAGFTPGALPAPVLARTGVVTKDGAACLLAAANPAFSTGRLIAAFALDQGGRPEAGVVGHGFRTGAVMAALANGTMGYACDLEPHHPEAILHPVAIMLPVTLALGERTGADGKHFLAAVALGCEVEYRVSMAIGPVQMYDLGFHPSAVAGCFGATAAAAFLLGLERDAVVRALGLAACQASGLMAWQSDPSENARPFQMGMAARNGVSAALLAAAGFGGPRAVFDHGHTVFRAFSRGPRPELLVADLGERWDGVMELAIKPYPSVSFLHPALDALLALVREHDLCPADIERLTLRFPRSGVHCVDGNPLKSHCAQYILPIAVARREVAVADLFEDRRLADPEVAALAKRTDVIADDALDALFPEAYASIIEIRTRDGRTLERRNDIARGYPETPLGEEDLSEKFRRVAGSVAAPDRVAALEGALAGLPKACEIDTLAALLCARPDASDPPPP
jgi:2-methylcitrate dehydratase PrpD